MMTDSELKEFNDFLQESPVRNQFLPVLNHICKLKPKEFNVEEWKDKKDKPIIKFYVKTNADVDIEGRVCFDWCGDIKPSVKDDIIFELWWDEENYRRFDNRIKVMNWLTLLLSRGNLPLYGFNIHEELKTYRKLETLVPIERYE
jgi:hypothetical protein